MDQVYSDRVSGLETVTEYSTMLGRKFAPLQQRILWFYFVYARRGDIAS